MLRQKVEVDEGQITSDDPKNPATARNVVLHPEEVPQLQRSLLPARAGTRPLSGRTKLEIGRAHV